MRARIASRPGQDEGTRVACRVAPLGPYRRSGRLFPGSAADPCVSGIRDRGVAQTCSRGSTLILARVSARSGPAFPRAARLATPHDAPRAPLERVRQGPPMSAPQRDAGRPRRAGTTPGGAPEEVGAPPQAGEPQSPTQPPPAPKARSRRRRPALEVDPLEEADASRALRTAIDRLVGDLVDRRDDDRS